MQLKSHFQHCQFAPVNEESPSMTVECAGCHKPIYDRYLLNVMDRHWHNQCIQCVDCGVGLTDRCFSRDGLLLCKNDFYRRYSSRCEACSQAILPNQLLRRVKDHMFHLNCFSCTICTKQLTTGDHIYVTQDNKFICKEDYVMVKNQGWQFIVVDNDVFTEPERKFNPSSPFPMRQLSTQLPVNQDVKPSIVKEENNIEPCCVEATPEPPTQTNSDEEIEDEELLGEELEDEIIESDNESVENKSTTASFDDEQDEKKCEEKTVGSKSKNGNNKRRGPRTTIKAKQLETLKTAFMNTPKPTRHIREQLAMETGLNMRVIQVWFQNRRSKERRMKQLSAIGARRAAFYHRRLRSYDTRSDLLHQLPYFPTDGSSPDFFHPTHPFTGFDLYSGAPPGTSFLNNSLENASDSLTTPSDIDDPRHAFLPSEDHRLQLTSEAMLLPAPPTDNIISRYTYSRLHEMRPDPPTIW